MTERDDILHWFDDVLTFMQEGKLARWAAVLPQQLELVLQENEHGDQQRWLHALQQLPAIEQINADLNRHDIALSSDVITSAQQEQLQQALEGLIPWRKGPFQFFGTHIDTEWRSDWKWDRVAPHLTPLDGRVVLDVGCGSGYHIWRMLGAGAYRVIGIDPSRLFLMQFQAYKRYLQAAGHCARADLLPLKMEDVPGNLKAFDTVFSMGVLYHRKSPVDHLQELKDALRPGGELVLETLVINGALGEVFMPEDRYAMMRNVWFIPSTETLLLWCRRVGFKNARVVDLNQTSLEEQRTTDWMHFNSLADFLDPQDRNKTVEGYPAPLRAVIIAEA
ncbi:MAG: tRNA 5-methoxyuridine(34)/uridine 5-oxyacetic acid(34) synthase CmoB [Saccharospirillaceae bacterium]|nr:tRNA 5-methoxyuridine(34)/uridine 5-oxyacetic acid(34) synthase CmoB [Saccharospirillaceae bacterium]MCD8529834.1 tRNA 5-methoxyuridine(34)/uridine 5-oxyacetic acid(34) synthase CmoB [Saccharospirillaceae bacterium]